MKVPVSIGRRAAKRALCLMRSPNPSERGFRTSISPHPPRSWRSPASVWPSAVRLSSRRPPTWTEGARRSPRRRSRALPAKSRIRAAALGGLSMPPYSRYRMGSDRATRSGSSPASRQQSEVPERGTPLRSQVRAMEEARPEGAASVLEDIRVDLQSTVGFGAESVRRT